MGWEKELFVLLLLPDTVIISGGGSSLGHSTKQLLAPRDRDAHFAAQGSTSPPHQTKAGLHLPCKPPSSPCLSIPCCRPDPWHSAEGILSSISKNPSMCQGRLPAAGLGRGT